MRADNDDTTTTGHADMQTRCYAYHLNNQHAHGRKIDLEILPNAKAATTLIDSILLMQGEQPYKIIRSYSTTKGIICTWVRVCRS